jgi:hypothetical protein
MTTRQGPKDPADEDSGLQVARAVARRVDKMEPRLGTVERQLGKVAQGLAIVNQREQKTPAGQPDWLGCRNPDQAKAILSTARAWLEDVGPVVKLDAPGCWPWHPRAVVLVVAASAHYRAAYAGDSAVTVTDYLTRYANALRTALVGSIDSECAGPSHAEGEARYLYDVDRLDALAIWWSTSREGLPPGLRPAVAAVR